MNAANRQANELSMFRPLNYGDTIKLSDGAIWEVGQGGYGWNLHVPGSKLKCHPTIKDIQAMQDLIGAILEHAQ